MYVHEHHKLYCKEGVSEKVFSESFLFSFLLHDNTSTIILNLFNKIFERMRFLKGFLCT